MKKSENLYHCYIMENRERNARKQRIPELETLYGFLRFRLKPDDYMEAEGLLNDLLAVVEKEAFISGIEYLSVFMRELLTE